ncbi:hypothetical protein CDAR_621521 [Caerostris darwini]|uniref:Uncharacterized protein n=1 Tax=Caerostris darwini TaxID=1538125 RepID=A0AAV4VBL8_9ARAC|nr:hypothetical protein CDAR_621521 [Caerostris darwini]
MFKLYVYTILAALITAQLTQSQNLSVESGISGALSSSYLACLNGCTNADEFVTTFTTAVLSSPQARDAFDCSSMSPSDFSRALSNDIRCVFNQNGIPGSQFLAKITVAPITQNFQTLTPTFILELYAKTVATNLINESILNAGNATILAKAFFDKVIESANLNCGKSGAQYKTTTIFGAYKSFLTSLGIFTRDKMLDGCFVFKTNVKSAASLLKVQASAEFAVY